MAREGHLIVMARPSQATQDEIAESLAPLRLRDKGGNHLVASGNWHQSFSCIHPPERRQAMRQAMSSVTARAFAMHLDVVRSEGSVPGNIHWQLIASGKKPKGMEMLRTELGRALERYCIIDTLGHSAHITLNYFARQSIQRVEIRPVTWIIDSMELVEVHGRGGDYRYARLDAWKLRPMTEAPAFQLDLLT